jgi:hypothetical protein
MEHRCSKNDMDGASMLFAVAPGSARRGAGGAAVAEVRFLGVARERDHHGGPHARGPEIVLQAYAAKTLGAGHG